MLTRQNSPKIRPDHLDRQALIYIRQSTMAQVRDHTGSTIRQYDLSARARSLGWPQEHIRIIDQDQGHSGASALGRDGFQLLVAEVGLKHAGAVLCLEASRLARSCSDWYQLLEICALTDTLLIDEEGVYDPSHYNDRLLLGFKGTMSEAELHWMHQRLLGGKLAKAELGQLRVRLPVGFLYDAAGQIIPDPDEEVRGAVQLAFDLFARLAFGARRRYSLSRPSATLPHATRTTRTRRRIALGASLALPPVGCASQPLLRPPLMSSAAPRLAGACEPAKKPQSKGAPGGSNLSSGRLYYSNIIPLIFPPDQFRANLQQLDDNRTSKPEEHRGAVREGATLLQGIALCGRCGRRMAVRYQDDGHTPWYDCNQLYRQEAAPYCQSLRGDAIDRAVAESFLAAIEGGTVGNLPLRTRADRSARGAKANVNGNSDWNASNTKPTWPAGASSQSSLRTGSSHAPWSVTGTRSSLKPSACSGSIWPVPPTHCCRSAPNNDHVCFSWRRTFRWSRGADTTTQAERKQLLRYLIKDVTLNKAAKTFQLSIRWQTETLTHLEIERPQKRYEQCRTSSQAINLIRQMAPNHTDKQIAAALNQAGLHRRMWRRIHRAQSEADSV